MSKFTLLPPAEEDDLHAKRLLNIEEKPFKRIQKRLLAPTNPFQEYLRRTPVDANKDNNHDEPTSDEEPTTSTNGAALPQTQAEIDAYLAHLSSFTHQTLHDFSALTTSLARLQFLLTSNEKERTRYTAQVSSITTQHATIRSNTSALRTRLSEARAQLATRKNYDALAEKVLWVDGRVGGVRAKTRDELGRESEKLRNEIEELEREGAELKVQWADRRDALGNVIAEAGRLRSVIRGEPEHGDVEEEKRDNDDGDGDRRSDINEEDGEHEQKRREDEDEGMLGTTDRGGEPGTSNAGTPRPIDDGGATPLPDIEQRDSGAATPSLNIHESGTRTPRSSSNAADLDGLGGFTPRPATAEGSSSGLRNEMQAAHDDDDDDVDMANLPQPEQHSVDVPEVRVDDAEKAEVGVDEMETS